MRDLQQLLRNAVAELDRETEAALRTARAREERAARTFLDGLDPSSQEGMWFDAVAASFASRVDAAIAYLRDVKPEAHDDR